MLNIFKASGKCGLNPENPAPDTWVDLSDPGPEELEQISAAFGVPRDFLFDSLDLSERSHINQEGEYTLIVNRVSVESAEGDPRPFRTLPLGVILTPMAVITVCRRAGLTQSLLRDKLQDCDYQDRVRFAFILMHEISTVCIRHLETLDQLTNEIEASMRETMRNSELGRMLQIEKTLVFFLTSLKANGMVLEKIRSENIFNLNQTSVRYLLREALTENRQAVQMAEIYTQIISSMSETFASMISNNMNAVMKFLTGLTMILMVPSIIVGIYGMNVPLPFQGHVLALPSIGVVTGLICFLLWRYLSKKHWM